MRWVPLLRRLNLWRCRLLYREKLDIMLIVYGKEKTDSCQRTAGG